MLKQKSVIPPLNISEINKRGVFLNSMRLNSLLNYSDIKEFPIWWSGFYIDNSRLNNPINSFKTKSCIINGGSAVIILIVAGSISSEISFDL